jgi:hypothetical protein
MNLVGSLILSFLFATTISERRIDIVNFNKNFIDFKLKNGYSIINDDITEDELAELYAIECIYEE